MKSCNKTKTSMLVKNIGSRPLSFVLVCFIVLELLSHISMGGIANAAGQNDVVPNSVNESMNAIDKWLSNSNMYTAWCYRSKERITQTEYSKLDTSLIGRYCQGKDNSGTIMYYRNKIADGDDKIEINGVLQKKTVGSCTWCALTDLLNRRIALECKGNETISGSDLFTFKEVAKVVSGNEGLSNDQFNKKYVSGTGKTDKGTPMFFYIDGYNGADYFNNHHFKRTSNGKAYDFTLKYVKDDLGSANYQTRQTKFKNLLDAHPEGILVYCGESHGYLLTGYYFIGGDTQKIGFYAHDTGGSTYGPGKYKITSVHIADKNSYSYGPNEYNIIMGITEYGYLLSNGTTSVNNGNNGNGATPTPTATPTPSANARATITNVHLGDPNQVEQLTEGSSCAVRGNVSGSGIATVEAFVALKSSPSVPIKYKNSEKLIVATDAVPNGTSYEIKKYSQIDNQITCSQIPIGDYYLVVRALDANGKQIGSASQYPFKVVPKAFLGTTKNGITIDLTGTSTTIKQGKSNHIYGSVTSNETIKSITARVFDTRSGQYGYPTYTYRDSSGTSRKIEAYAYPNTKEYILYRTSPSVVNSAIDNGISFGKLAAGYYYALEIKVVTVSGKECVYQLRFTVTN